MLISDRYGALRAAMPPDPASDDAPRPKYDPLYRHALREAAIILAVFAVCFIWAIVCYLTLGLSSADDQPGEIATVLGIPRWVFWGIAVPWLLADLFIALFCLVLMKDDDLGEVHEGEDLDEQLHAPHNTPETAG